jgi:flagellar biosynthetic protein FliR
MVFDIDSAWVISIFLVALRLGTFLIVNPVFSNLSGLVTVRLLFTLALCSAMVASLKLPTSVPLKPGALIPAALSEIVVGGALAFGVVAAFAAFSIAGRILDVQSGFGIGSVFDPVTRSGSPIFTTMLNLLAVAVFFGMDGHHALMRGIAFSLQQVPPGTGLSVLSHEAVLRQFGMMFSLAVSLAAPAMFCLFLVEAGLAIMARAMPRMHIFQVAMPVRIFSGIALLALSIGTMGPVMARVFASIFAYWEQVLR